uniref:Slc25a-20 n=1 Tax=Schmidtea mediterranea TaxID=79327 RepID=A0A0H3YKB7_SCHMD|nr:slc25a-20 [Schmidtea mediterranea]
MSTNSAFTAGALSGFIVRLITQPLDVLKIRFQLQVEPISKDFKDSYYKNIKQASKRIYLEEGIFGFWKGHVPAQYLSIVFGAVQFRTFEALYSKTGYSRTSTNNLLFGGVAGSTATLFCQPIDVLRTRLVSQGEYKKYKSLTNAILKMSAEEGVYGFFRGLVPTVLMIFPQTAIQFGIYHQLKSSLSSMRIQSNQNYVIRVYAEHLSNDSVNALVSGSVAGIVAKTVIYPLDLAKRRLQVQGFEDARQYFGKFHHSLRMVHSIRKTVLEEGISGLFKGLLPSSIKSGVVSSLTFFFYEKFSKMI